MKHQQVTVDFIGMMFTACSYLALAGAVWILLRLLQACFWLPRHLQKQNNVQKMLQEKVDSYEKYILECEEQEKNMLLTEDGENDETNEKSMELEKKWKERRECLEVLKRELNRVQDGNTSYDWDYLLEQEGLKLDDPELTDFMENELSADGAFKHKISKENTDEVETIDDKQGVKYGAEEKKDK